MMKHIYLAEGRIHQDARDVRTKFRKTIDSFFLGNVDGRVRHAFEDWVNYLRSERGWGDDDPLFPATEVDVLGGRRLRRLSASLVTLTTDRGHSAYLPSGLARAAGLPYQSAQQLNTVVVTALQICRNGEDFKAVSQNLGHTHAETTFTVYGGLPVRRQGELVTALGKRPSKEQETADIIRQVIREEPPRIPARVTFDRSGATTKSLPRRRVGVFSEGNLVDTMIPAHVRPMKSFVISRDRVCAVRDLCELFDVCFCGLVR